MPGAASLSSKRQKIRNHCNEEDRISRLPDEVLSHLLSFLPTKYAVLTGILSKRWGSIWTMVPNLDFNDTLMFNPNSENLSRDVCFINFVDRVFNLRDNCSPLQTFHLTCRDCYDPSHINSWIYSAVAHGVREIDLSYLVGVVDLVEEDLVEEDLVEEDLVEEGVVDLVEEDLVEKDLVELPRSLFNSEKLEVLKLQTNIRLQNPDSICLPSLRVLHLIWLLYNFDRGSTVNNLISSCPVLEELVIEREYDDSLEHLVINSCSLKRLKIRADLEEPDFFNECNVVVDAPNLESINLSHCLSGSYDLKSEFPLLVKAKIDVMQFDGDNEDPALQQNLIELLRAFSNVRFLTLSDNTMNILGRSTLNLANPISMPEFCMLTHLEVKIGSFGWLILPKLLKCLPHLKDFVFHNYMISVSYKPPRMPDYEFKCLSKLERIEFKGFERCEAEIELIKYFLKNAKVLKKLTIHSRYMGLHEDLLIRFPRSSECCELVVLPDYYPQYALMADLVRENQMLTNQVKEVKKC